MAKVSVFIPVYNCEKYLSHAIESVLSQTFTDWELLIIDDNSTDNSYSIAENYSKKSPKIKCLRNPSNLGMLRNWNKGIDLCLNEYFVKLDADDVWKPSMLEKAIKILNENQEFGLVFSRYTNVDEKGNEISENYHPLPQFARNNFFSCVPLVKQGPDKMLSYAVLRQGLSVMRREIFNKIGHYRFLSSEITQSSTDTEFYFRLGCHYKIFCIDEVLYQYRKHSKSISASDKANELQPRKLFEIKSAIVKYYSEQDKISKREAIAFQKKITFDYRLFQTATKKQKGKYLGAILLLFRNFVLNPFLTIRFYCGRIFY